MNSLAHLKTYSINEARDNLYSLVKSAAKGTRAYEIGTRSGESVILLAKTEVESWLETLDILTSSSEIAAVRKSRKQKKTVSHKDVLKTLGLAS